MSSNRTSNIVIGTRRAVCKSEICDRLLRVSSTPHGHRWSKHHEIVKGVCGLPPIVFPTIQRAAPRKVSLHSHGSEIVLAEKYIITIQRRQNIILLVDNNADVKCPSNAPDETRPFRRNDTCAAVEGPGRTSLLRPSLSVTGCH